VKYCTGFNTNITHTDVAKHWRRGGIRYSTVNLLLGVPVKRVPTMVQYTWLSYDKNLVAYDFQLPAILMHIYIHALNTANRSISHTCMYWYNLHNLTSLRALGNNEIKCKPHKGNAKR